MSTFVPVTGVKGFCLRALASAIDGLLVMAGGWSLFFIGLGSIMMFRSGPEISSLQTQLIESGLEVLIWIPYYTWFHAKKGWTPGKRVFGLVVLSTHGELISVGKSFGRTFGYLLSYAPIGAGFLMAAFNPKGQGLHDLVVSTQVFRRVKV